MGFELTLASPGIFAQASTLVLLPVTLVIERKTIPEANWHVLLPPSIQDIVVVFDTLPDGNRPGEWAPSSPHTAGIFDVVDIPPLPTTSQLVREMITLITDSNISSRRWTFVNTGRIRPDFLPNQTLTPDEMESYVKEELAKGLKEELKVESEVKQGDDVLQRVNFRSMRDFIQRGIGLDMNKKVARDLIPVEVLDKWLGGDERRM